MEGMNKKLNGEIFLIFLSGFDREREIYIYKMLFFKTLQHLDRVEKFALLFY